MGFRSGAYCTIWEASPVSPSATKLRISIDRKDKNTGEYITEFSGFPLVVGAAAAKNALSLKPKDRIKLGDVDVTCTYDKEKQREFVSYKIFSYDMADGSRPSSSPAPQPVHEVDDGEVSDGLPF